MGYGTRFTPGGDWQQQLDQAIKAGMDELVRDHTRMAESLGPRYRGRPVEEIKPVLQREWHRLNGGSITDPELTEFAQAISDGRTVEFRNSGIRR